MADTPPTPLHNSRGGVPLIMLATIVAQPQTLEEANVIIEALQAELYEAYRDPIWGVLSRQGVERRMQQLDHTYVAIVGDGDDIHGKNRRFGHDGVDARMTAGLRGTDSGRWLRGDEVVFFVPRQDAAGAAERIRQNLLQQEMPMTLCITYAATHEAIAAGQVMIEIEKDAGRRGHILRVEGGAA